MGLCNVKQTSQKAKKKIELKTQETNWMTLESDRGGVQPILVPITDQFVEHQKNQPVGIQFDVIHKESSVVYTIGLVEKQQVLNDKMSFVQKFQLFATIVHPHIQRWFDIYETNTQYQVVKECVRGITFSEYLQYSKISQNKLRTLIFKIMSAINQLHIKGLIHKYFIQQSKSDIRNETIIFENKQQDSEFKIITIQESKNQSSDHFRAPEALKNLYHTTTKSDVWSLGVLLYFSLIGELPFDGKDQDQIRGSIQRGIIDYNNQAFDSLQQEAINLLKRMLQFQPSKRPNLQNCMSDSWFKIKPDKLSKHQIQLLSETQDRIASFNCRSKIQQATMLMIIEQSQQNKQVNQILSIFKKLDKDNSGTLSRKELTDGFLKIMPLEQAQQVVDQLFRDYDIDGSGFVDYNEFVLSLCMKSRHIREDKILKVFNQYDTDKNGSLSLQEIKRLLIRMNLSEQEILAALKDFDKDQNGEISQEEFVQGMLMINTNKPKMNESATKSENLPKPYKNSLKKSSKSQTNQ